MSMSMPGPLPLIRDAVPADRPAIVEFNRLLAAETEHKVLDPAILDQGVARALAEPDRLRYWVAGLPLDNGRRLVGQTAITREWSDWRNGWIWWIQSVYVRREARQRGIFRALYEHIVETARQRGVIGIRLYVEEENHAAHKTYERLGMPRSGYFVMERMPL